MCEAGSRSCSGPSPWHKRGPRQKVLRRARLLVRSIAADEFRRAAQGGGQVEDLGGRGAAAIFAVGVADGAVRREGPLPAQEVGVEPQPAEDLAGRLAPYLSDTPPRASRRRPLWSQRGSSVRARLTTSEQPQHRFSSLGHPIPVLGQLHLLQPWRRRPYRCTCAHLVSLCPLPTDFGLLLHHQRKQQPRTSAAPRIFRQLRLLHFDHNLPRFISIS